MKNFGGVILSQVLIHQQLFLRLPKSRDVAILSSRFQEIKHGETFNFFSHFGLDIVWHRRWESRQDDDPFLLECQQSQTPWRRKRMHRPQHPRRSVGFLLPLIWDPNHWDISLGYFAKLIWSLPQSGHLKRENVYYKTIMIMTTMILVVVTIVLIH